MPKAPETDPLKLAQRLERKRAFARERTRQYRGRIKERVDSVLNTALDAVVGDPVDPGTLHSPAVPPAAMRTARAILRRILTRHGVTLDRVVQEIRKALDATKLRRVGGADVSQKDWQATLRATDQSLRLLERAGQTPGTKDTGMAENITVNVLVLSGVDGKPHSIPLVATCDGLPEVQASPHAGSSRDEALQKAKLSA